MKPFFFLIGPLWLLILSSLFLALGLDSSWDPCLFHTLGKMRCVLICVIVRSIAAMEQIEFLFGYRKIAKKSKRKKKR